MDYDKTLVEVGASSVYAYVRRTAEESREGVCWQTFSFANEPQYVTNAFNGVAGITLFLSGYGRMFPDSEAHELSRKALQWCSMPNRRLRQDFPDASDASLMFGWAGIGMAWLRYYQASQDSDALEGIARMVTAALAAEPGADATLNKGLAGQGIFLLRAYEELGRDELIGAAQAIGRRLLEMAVREGPDVRWQTFVGGLAEPVYFLGLGRGSAGIGHLFLELHRTTGESLWADMATECAQTVLRHARKDRGGLGWPLQFGDEDLTDCRWCLGAPGAGWFLVRAYEQTDEAEYLEAAESVGRAVVTYGDVRRNPSQCHGLAGSAGFLIELYRITGKSEWVEQAFTLSEQIFTYRKVTLDGDEWQADEPDLHSPEFMCGASGTGYCFLQLLDPQTVSVPLIA